jgi:hypothetical protein
MAAIPYANPMNPQLPTAPSRQAELKRPVSDALQPKPFQEQVSIQEQHAAHVHQDDRQHEWVHGRATRPDNR